MGFKSKVTPCFDVIRFDGKRCLGFVEKQTGFTEGSGRLKRRRKVNFLA